MTRDFYRCTSQTCEDNGGCCEINIPHGYEPPLKCVNPDSFEDSKCDCKWTPCQSNNSRSDELMEKTTNDNRKQALPPQQPEPYKDCELRESRGSLYGEWFECGTKHMDCKFLREHKLCPEHYR